MNYNLNGGVLIIGSLFWQDDRDNGDGIRKRWRDIRLEMNKSIKVSAPIRYGRFSGSPEKRNQTYTMVFDKSLPNEKFGRAKVVPFKKSIVNWNDLKEEVEELSEAEGTGKDFIKGNSAWCICCIVFNKKVSLEKKNDILNKWSQVLNENQAGSNYFLQNSTSYGCTPQGELEIPWPIELKDLDFLIATSTQPSNRIGITDLTAQEITIHIGNRKYFIPNFLLGIGTYQDRDILNAINSDKNLTQLLFKSIIENYELKKHEDKNHRYWSWDFCREAFHSNQLDDVTKALHLANYLASWGMNRGSGGLLQKNYKIHIKAIEILTDVKYTSLDCFNGNDFTKDKIKHLFKLVDELSDYYSSITYDRMGDQESITPTDTLISKILLGTLSCVPAFDQFLKMGLELGLLSNRRLSKRGLSLLLAWIDKNEIVNLRASIHESASDLPVMKLLDIYFWSLGYQVAINEK